MSSSKAKAMPGDTKLKLVVTDEYKFAQSKVCPGPALCKVMLNSHNKCKSRCLSSHQTDLFRTDFINLGGLAQCEGEGENKVSMGCLQ